MKQGAREAVCLYNQQFELRMSELKYRINSVASEHARYPASNLTINQEGWQSSIDCTYPQALTIQFFIPIRTKKMHLLFHQYKIPKLIEVYVKLGAAEKYRKIGYITPNDNLQSSFEQKQQKTLYFELTLTHIRLVLHQNYKNSRNVFSQVGLEDLIVFGELLSSREMERIDLTEQQSSDEQVTQSIEVSHNGRTFETKAAAQEQAIITTQTSPIFRQIFQKLEFEKQSAVESEDYQKAANFKKMITNYKQLEEEISRLERQKHDALRREDYDRCHKIKFEISKKKEIVEFQRNELFKNEEQFYSQNSLIFPTVERDVPALYESKRKMHSPAKLPQFKSPQPDRKLNNSSLNRHDEQVVPALRNKNKSSQNLPLQTNQKRREIILEINQSIIPEVANEIDNTSIKKDLNQLRELNENPNQVSISIDGKMLELLPLENKLRMRIETYFNFIPERIWQLGQSKHWKAKQEALKFLRQRLDSIQTKQEFMGTIQLISRIIISKQAAISLDVIHLINRLTQVKIKFTLQHLPFFVENILSELLNFLNDTNKQIKQLAYTTYLKLPEISFLGLNIVTRELIKHKNHVKNDPKLIINKLQLMGALLENYSQHQFSHKDVITWILSYFDDPNQKVKAQASQLLVTLTYLIGNEKVLKLIEINRPQMMESVLNMMNNSVEYSKIQNQQSKLSLQNSKLQHQFYGNEPPRYNKPSNASKVNPIDDKSEKPLFILESQEKPYKMEQSKHSHNENANVNLSYSKQSIYESSILPSHIRANDEQIKVYEEIPYQEEGKCSYCAESYVDERDHYINDCKVLIFCDKCNGYIYIREFTHHLLNDCEFSHQFSLCKKCNLAIELEDINEHIGRDLCRNKKGLNWERCQFCSEDVLSEDKFWIKHAHECRNLPLRNDADYSNHEDDDE